MLLLIENLPKGLPSEQWNMIIQIFVKSGKISRTTWKIGILLYQQFNPRSLLKTKKKKKK